MPLCSDIAAPTARGFCRIGVANVLSTTTGTPGAWAAIPAMSTSSSEGLPGDSRTTIPVSGRTDAATSLSEQ